MDNVKIPRVVFNVFVQLGLNSTLKTSSVKMWTNVANWDLKLVSMENVLTFWVRTSASVIPDRSWIILEESVLVRVLFYNIFACSNLMNR